MVQAPARIDTRDRIMAAALELFGEYGFDGTSLQQIADRMGLTKAALYYHFRSKDDLLEAVFQPAFNDLEARLAVFEGARPTPATRRAGLESYLDFLIEHRNVIGFLTRDLAMLSHPAVADRVRVGGARIMALLTGVQRDANDRITSSLAISGMQGVVVANPDEDPDLLRAVVLAATEAVLRSGRRHTGQMSAASA